MNDRTPTTADDVAAALGWRGDPFKAPTAAYYAEKYPHVGSLVAAAVLAGLEDASVTRDRADAILACADHDAERRDAYLADMTRRAVTGRTTASRIS